MLYKKIFFTILGLFLLFGIKAHTAFASEGQFNLQNRLESRSRCIAYSVEVKLNTFHVLVSCRGLIYPPLPPNLDSYIMWADGGDLTGATKLTDLLYGKGEAVIEGRFERIFVTLERGSPKSPLGPTIMESTVQPLDFDRTSTVSNPNTIPSTNITQSPSETVPTIIPTPTPAKTPFWQSNFGKMVIVVSAGFLIFVFILMVYGSKK